MSKKRRRTAQNSQIKPAVKQEDTVPEEDKTEEIPADEAVESGEAAAAEREEAEKSEKTAANSDNQQATAIVQQKPKASKGIIAGFSVMGAVIICLIIALVATNLDKAAPAVNTGEITSAVKEQTSVPDETTVPAKTTAGETENTAVSSDETTAAATTEAASEVTADAPETTAAVTTRAETTAAATTTAATEKKEETTAKEENQTADKGVIIMYSADNSWENGSETMYGLQLGISNRSGESVSGWNLVLEIEGLSSCQGWNGTYEVSGNKLTVTNADYNGDIVNGGDVVIGCNLGVTTSLNIKSAKLNGQTCTVKKGTVDQNAVNDRNNQNNQNNQGAVADVSGLLKRSDDAVQGDDWLHTDGRRILDKNGKEVWLTGVNWFGYNTGTNTFDGLWNSRLKPSVEAIADHGFNLIRVPISAQLINQWAAGEYPDANYNHAYNEELNSMNSLEIFDYFLKLAEENGIKVMPDIHSAETDASGHNVNLWYTSNVSVEQYYSALEWMAERYKDNDTIIAYDLKNEPHGKPYEGSGAAIWNDSDAKNNWKKTAETAAAKILAKNPNVLIMVEGTEIYPIDLNSNSDYHSTNDKDYYFNWWGGNLRGVRDYPINLGKYQDKLVYSPHDYGPAVYRQPWFEGNYTFDSLMKDCWRDNWFYIYENNTAPLLIGEWGGYMSEPNITWMTYMRKLIKDNHLNHTFWCFNANSGDTGGLVLDDFTTWDEEKYAFVKEVLWQEGGKFVGLDHAIPLGKNGITLSDANGLS
ncbi:MAG: cellulase family glycosylhydrolase [Ruminiclostridium sp.]